MFRRPLSGVEHRIPNIPNVFFEDFLAEIFAWDSHKSSTVERVIMDFQPLSFSPHVVKHTLNLVERRSFAVEVTNDKIFVDFSSCFED